MTVLTSEKPELVEYITLFTLVLLPNILLINFFSGLIHDDAFQLELTYKWYNKSFFGEVYLFNPFRENLLFHLATYGSPLLARLFIVCVYLCGGAVLLYHLLAKQLSIPKTAAFIVASLPYLSASIWQIPNGINISYVAGDVFFTIISLIIIAYMLQRKTDWLVAIPLIGILYILSTELQFSSPVTTPILFAAAVLFPSKHTPVRILLIAIMSYAVFHVFTGEIGSSRKNVATIGQALNNYLQFQLNGVSVTNPNLPSILWIAHNVVAGIGLILGTLIVLPSRDKTKSILLHIWDLIKTPAIAVGLIALAILLWSPVAYAFTTASVEATQSKRYYFIWLFGYWGLWGTGISLVIGFVTKFANSRKLSLGGKLPDLNSAMKKPTAYVISGLIVTSFSVHKSKAVPQELIDGSRLVRQMQPALRNSLRIRMDMNRQLLLILDHPSVRGSHQPSLSHVSHPKAGFGLINYMLSPQTYGHASIALHDRCSGIFDKYKANYGYYDISGFDINSPITVVKYTGASQQVIPFDYLLDFGSPKQGRLISLVGKPEIIGEFTSPQTLTSLLSEKGLNKETIGFASAYLAGQCKFSDRSWSPVSGVK